MPKKRVISKGLMIYNLRRKFRKLNPDEDVEAIEWEGIDYPCSHESALHDFENQYSEYKWFEEETLDEAEMRERDYEIENLVEELESKGVNDEIIQKIVDTMDLQPFKGKWKRGWVAGKETYIKFVPIVPHTKEMKQGRIQTTCIPELIGLNAKITIVVPDEENNDWE